jgi:hypothetical protein
VLWPYPIGAGPRTAPARIDRWLSPGARRLEHHSIVVGAEPRAALAAIGAVRLRDVPIVGALFTLRGIPHRADTTLLQFFGTSPFLILEEEAGRELVFGVVGPFWDWRRGRVPLRIPSTRDEFRAALAEGRMAAVGNFRVEPEGSGSRLWTETWVSAPGFTQAAVFTAYWMLIGPFSAWTRRLLLRAGRRRAEAGKVI